ncbi:glycerophosphodiester phosphodiesterase family protein [Boseongicola aestuarii]|uniref:Glycerophosphoryl diester phosphodiesterase n=1 Tax=Boseongicola aestuarii TaxID=1470561 RepID=A0A238J1H9_9RHOB|nr:glycerophosphodiester phosphodiesterase family protein [Boseongicola aestuarii]SMX24516.1 Glycerophosphoryl diester phosphodiesterase precursor [Boseongicola aestuarii]
MPGRSDLAITAFALLAWAFPLAAQNTVDARFARDQPPIVMAHRSATIEGYPENTLEWIEGAIKSGIDMVHINPQLTADGKYVLMHDSTLNRMTDVEDVFPKGPPGGPTRAQRGGKDYVRDYTLEEIRDLRVVGFPGFGAYGVPTLSEALDLVDGRALIALGLKAYEIESLSGTLQRQDTQNLLLYELHYSGSEQSKLRILAETAEIAVGLALVQSGDYLKELEDVSRQLDPYLRMVSIKSSRLSPEFIAQAGNLGLRVAVSGWASREDFALIERDDPQPWLAVLEADLSVVTDAPEAVLRLMGR